jgi:hypothetical protein
MPSKDDFLDLNGTILFSVSRKFFLKNQVDGKLPPLENKKLCRLELLSKRG